MPLRFALVAVIVPPKRLTRVVAKGAIGQRNAIVALPAVTFAGTDAAARVITVSGPGQNVPATI